jgi:hypothetical protein
MGKCCGVSSNCFARAQSAIDPSAIVQPAETVVANWPKIAEHSIIQVCSLGETGPLQVAESFPVIDVQFNASFTAISARE